LGSLREGDRFEGRDVDGEIILKPIFSKWDREVLTGSSWLRIGTGEYGNEHSGFM
jgi:hypothetical protein